MKEETLKLIAEENIKLKKDYGDGFVATNEKENDKILDEEEKKYILEMVQVWIDYRVAGYGYIFSSIRSTDSFPKLSGMREEVIEIAKLFRVEMGLIRRVLGENGREILDGFIKETDKFLKDNYMKTSQHFITYYTNGESEILWAKVDTGGSLQEETYGLTRDGMLLDEDGEFMGPFSANYEPILDAMKEIDWDNVVLLDEQ